MVLLEVVVGGKGEGDKADAGGLILFLDFLVEPDGVNVVSVAFAFAEDAFVSFGVEI